MPDNEPPDVVTAIRTRIEAGALSLPTAFRQPLEGRRGEGFCASCVQDILLSNRRVDRLLLDAEGWGALRRHAPCTVSGKDRLVIGLGPVGDRARTPVRRRRGPGLLGRRATAR